MVVARQSWDHVSSICCRCRLKSLSTPADKRPRQGSLTLDAAFFVFERLIGSGEYSEEDKVAESTTQNETEKIRRDSMISMVPGERFTPYTLARKLGAKMILESSSFQKGKERYSLLMAKEAFKVVQEGDQVYLELEGIRRPFPDKGGDILEVLMYFGKQHRPLHQDLPVPAGGIGYLSYEFASRCDTIRFQPKPDPLELPDACFLFGHVFVVFDHYTDIIYLIGLNYEEHQIDLEEALKATEAKMNDLDFNYLSNDAREYAAEYESTDEERDAYMRRVERIREEIIAGNLLQAVPSRRLKIKTDLPALDAYKNLRSKNPSPYLFYLDFGDYQLFGASPEMHVRVKDNRATIRPIAGTRRRGRDAEEDARLAEELLSDEKERAEHLMLVDLARNDLGRFCRPGSVAVTKSMEIERYSHVMHIVSQVEGELAEGATGIDAIRATFPAGTVTGAPKIRAIETVDALEDEPRRFYAGLVGYIQADGGLDSCITIRSALKTPGYMYLQAGGGVVFDSKPEREYEETNEKLRALATILGLEV